MKEELMLLENKLKTLQVCKPYLLQSKSNYIILSKLVKLIILDEADNMTKAA